MSSRETNQRHHPSNHVIPSEAEGSQHFPAARTTHAPKWSVILSHRRRISVFGAATISCALLAHAELPTLLQHAIANSTIESALFRLMELPGVKALYPRPPKEAQAELQKLLTQNTNDANLYSLKAMEDEQALDFTAAESDWKAYAAHAQDRIAAQLQLADFYHRRLQADDEVRVLMEVAAEPSSASEAYVDDATQRSWTAFTRILAVAGDQAMDNAITQRAYEAWLTRYPHEATIYAQYFTWLLSTQQYDAAAALVTRYQQTFPAEPIFPVKANALLELRRGNTQKSLAVYDASFQPLWPQELIDSYFTLLAQVHQERTLSRRRQSSPRQEPRRHQRPRPRVLLPAPRRTQRCRTSRDRSVPRQQRNPKSRVVCRRAFYPHEAHAACRQLARSRSLRLRALQRTCRHARRPTVAIPSASPRSWKRCSQRRINPSRSARAISPCTATSPPWTRAPATGTASSRSG